MRLIRVCTRSGRGCEFKQCIGSNATVRFCYSAHIDRLISSNKAVFLAHNSIDVFNKGSVHVAKSSMVRHNDIVALQIIANLR